MNYFSFSKNILTSFLVIFPLLVLYELIAFLKFSSTSFVIRNTADSIFRDIITIFTTNVSLAQSIIIIIFFTIYISFNIHYIKNYTFKLKYILMIYLESFILGVILIFLLNGIYVFNNINNTFYDDYILSFYLCLGAGIWEEILFRFVLINIFAFIFKFIFKKSFNVIFLSFVLSSLIFSLFHYIGSFADTFYLYSFFIRFIGGLCLSSIYYYRGLGISILTHFVYDFVLVSYNLI
tara:strand:- start:701 stop:1408 length:708 start_codon:yes stop_codon:yes gene_type:complete